MESTDPYTPKDSGEDGSKLDIGQARSTDIEPQDGHWLRMDPSLTRAVLAKTEEDLLGSLAALMRNKVEYEQSSRRFAQIQIDTEQAKHLLQGIREQIRRAETEVASRLNEQKLINEDLVRLRAEVDGLREERRKQAEMVSGLEKEVAEKRQTLQQAAEEEKARAAAGLPLLFEPASHIISPDWNSYPLESEFHTDEALDAKKVAQLVSTLPGLQGCLIVKNRGSVLASEMPERIHGYLQVPGRDYQLLFERLEHKLEEYILPNAHLATFDLGEEALTVAQASQAFVLVNHKQSKLRPGMPGKLASIVSEVAKMYP
jgi:hypothetical protein